MTKSIFLPLMLLLFSCASNKVPTIKSSTELNEQNDTLKYEKLSNRFYKGSDGEIYIKTQSLIKPPEEYGPEFYRKVPVQNFESYVKLSGYYAKDKFNVYRDIGTTDGRNIVIIEQADSKTFTVINYRLGMDKSHMYYNGIIVREINVDSLVILCDNPSTDFISSYRLIKDNKNVFYKNKKMETIDAKSFECICKDSTIIYQDKYWIYEDAYFPSMNPEKRTARN